MSSQNITEKKPFKKPSSWKVFRRIVLESCRCTYLIFKQLTFTFCLFWFPFSCLVITVTYSETTNTNMIASMSSMVLIILSLLENCFLVFLIPYFVYVYLNNKQNKESPLFSDFLKENVFSLVINHIKAFFVILLYLLLLIIPGLIKALRLFFVSQATFFDKDFHKDHRSALKASQETTKGYLFLIFFFFILPFVGSFAISSMFSILKFNLTTIDIIIRTLGYFVGFYFHSFILILMTQAYFIFNEIQKSSQIEKQSSLLTHKNQP